jgi:hypothetical protein
MRFVENCGLSESDKAGFANANWVRLTGEVTM